MRVPALAATIAAAIVAGLAVVPGHVGRAQPARAATVDPFTRLAQTADRYAATARREQLQRMRVFPVRGPFNWGQEAADFGGPRGCRSHEGQDVLSREGTLEVAVASATVLETGDDGGRGNYLVLWDRARRVTYVYMHMQSPPRVKPGEHVTAGQRVGKLGCTGSCDGPHLHFEVRDGKGIEGTAHDPRPLLARLARRDGVGATLPPGQG